MNEIKDDMHEDVDNSPDMDEADDEKKLTDWKNPPKLSDLQQNFKDALPFQQAQVSRISTWLDNLNVTGSAVIKTAKGNSSIVPKLIRKQAEWRYAALSEPFLSTDDVFKVRPVTWEDRKAAQQNQLVLNNQFNTKMRKVDFIDTYVRTAVDEGTVIVRLGWDFQEEQITKQVPKVEYRIDRSMEEELPKLDDFKLNSPSEYAELPEDLRMAHEKSLAEGVPLRATVVGYTAVESMRTTKNCPTLDVCDYRNIVIDPTCLGDTDKANFIVYSFETSLSELRKEGKYKNLDEIKVTANSILSEPDHAISEGAKNFDFQDDPRKKLVVHEYWGYWDINKTGTVESIVAAWIGSTLIRLEVSPFPDKKLPFVVVQYLPVRRSIYGEPDGVLIEDNQKIVGAVTRGMIDIMGKSANGQTGMRKDMLDVTNKRKYANGDDYEFNPTVSDPRQGIHMHTYPEIPQSASFMLQMQNAEAESLTGVKSFSNGISGAGLGEVAAGVRGALDAASKRELGILRRLSHGIEAIGRKIISMNAEFLEEAEVVRVTNETFVKVRRDDLPGDFDLKIGVSTAEEDDKKSQELSFMLQTLGNNIDGDMTKLLLSDIARLRKMPELSEKIENFKPTPNPMAEQKAQLELALLQAQIATEQAKAAHYGATSMLSQTKADTEVVKQSHVQADTDKRNLDYVEQETGVKQERDLQKQGEQARANGQLAVLKHHLDNKLDEDAVKRQIKPKK